MNRFNTVAMAACGAALMACFAAPAAKADDWSRKTEITFANPVEIPGVHLAGWGVLPAGTYVFRILDSQSDRHIVQIFSQDEKTVYATILAIPNYRLKATDKTVMTFNERPVGQPEALRAWFYPGMNWGEEFVYPKDKAIELAKTAQAPVLFTSAEIPLEVAEPIKSADAPLVVELKQAPVMAIKPTGQELQLTDVVTPPPAQTETAGVAPAPAEAAKVQTATAAPAPAEAVKTLPATASPLPLIGLLGLLLLGSAFALRATAKRFE